MGNFAHNSMRLKGMVREKEVIVFIDSGANHNFISKKLIRSVGIKVIRRREFKVMVGDGHKVRSKHYKCVEVCLFGFKLAQIFTHSISELWM